MVFFAAFLVAFGFLAAFLVLFFAAFGIVRLVSSQGTWIDEQAEQPLKCLHQKTECEWLVCVLATQLCARMQESSHGIGCFQRSMAVSEDNIREPRAIKN